MTGTDTVRINVRSCRIAWCLALFIVMGACSSTQSEESPAPNGDSPLTDAIVLEEVEVMRVEDGDSMVVLRQGIDEHVRLQGINAPERDECLGDEARSSLEALVGERPAIGLLDSGEAHNRDQYGRLLAHVFADGVYVNQRQIEIGHAIAMSTDQPFREEIFVAEEQAQTSEVGLWSPASCGGGPIPDLVIVRVDSNPPGPDDEAMNDEQVFIRNDGDERVDMHGFVLRDESTVNRYVFGTVVLEPDDEIAVASGCDPGGSSLAWCAESPIWNNAGDTALLLDPDGRVISAFRVR